MMKGLCVSLVALSSGARFKRHREASGTIAGIEVHNYQADAKEWIVMFRAGTSDASISKVCNGMCKLMGHPDKAGIAFAKFEASASSLGKALEGNSDLVESIEGDQMVYAIPEMENRETRSLASWGLERVGVAGRAYTGKGTHIYVQDTGVRVSHTDFGGRAVAAYDLSLSDGTDCTKTEVSCGGDKQGHGSHCAGSAAGTTFGVAPDALIYAVKTLSDQGSGTMAWQYAGIDYVATSGAKPAVLSMSLGGQGKAPAFDAAFQAAIDAGVIAVVAAGNSNTDTCGFSPAFSSNAITVGATDSNNKRASYSNYGTCNDIMAPGSAIVSVNAGGDTGARALSGTSMACPHVSGAVALLYESDPGMTKDEALAALKENAINNFISGIKANDPNYFLWVSAEDAPQPAPTPAPPPAPACRRRWFC